MYLSTAVDQREIANQTFHEGERSYIQSGIEKQDDDFYHHVIFVWLPGAERTLEKLLEKYALLSAA